MGKSLLVGVALSLGLLIGLCIALLIRTNDRRSAVTQNANEQTAKTPDRARHVLVDELLALLNDKHFMEMDQRSATHVIELLGELRVRQAVPALIRILNFETSGDPVTYNGNTKDGHVVLNVSMSSNARYRHAPALISLVRIGEPSMPAAIEILKRGDLSPDCLYMSNLLYGIRGEKAVDVVQVLIKGEKDIKIISRLETCLDWMRKEKGIFPEVLEARRIRLIEDDPNQYGSPLQQYRETWQFDIIAPGQPNAIEAPAP